jgi:pimeloyl-ACP methyl ester carboxylesterase
MAELERPDGASIHYELRGEGPLVALASYWSWSPGVFAELFAELERDHRVLTYDMRGTGRSTRRGPYDIETDVADLEALLDETDTAVGALAVGDSVNRIAKLAARRPDLLVNAVCFGAPPLRRSVLDDEDVLAASETVVAAFHEMLARDYRSALRSSLATTNPQLSEAERRQRVDAQVEYCPQEAALARNEAWTTDDPMTEASRLGERLCVLAPSEQAGTLWFPRPDQLKRLTRKLYPEARLAVLEEGMVSDPGGAAALIRSLI